MRKHLETLQSDGTYVQSTVVSGFISPWGVAVDSVGNLYVADNGHIYSGDPSGGAVYKETLANGQYIQSSIGSGWGAPSGIAVDGAGNVYVTDIGLPLLNGDVPSSVRKERPSAKGYEQSYIGHHWWGAAAVAVDGDNNLYVVDFSVGIAYRETPLNGAYVQSVVREVAGDQLLLWMYGVAVDADKNVYTTDAFANNVSREECGSPPLLGFGEAAYHSPQRDLPQTVRVSNLGNDFLGFSSVSYPPDFPETSAVDAACNPHSYLEAGESCTFNIEFKPAEPLGGATTKRLQEYLKIRTDTLNRKDTKQQVSLVGQQVLVTATPVFSPASGTTFKSPGTVTITDSTPGAKIYYEEGDQDPTLPYGAVPYTGPIKFECGKCTLKAIAVAPGYIVSEIATATYFYKGKY